MIKKMGRKCWQGHVEKGTPLTLLMRMEIGTAIIENSMEIYLRKTQRNFQKSSNLTSGFISKGDENTISKRYMHSMFTAALFTVTKVWKQHKCSSEEKWINKVWYTHTQCI